MFTNFGSWDEMFKNQQKMMETWTDFMNKSSDFSKMNPFAVPNFEELQKFDYFKQQQEMMKSWQDFIEQNSINFGEFQPNIEEWQKVMKEFNPLQTGKLMSKTAEDVFEKMMHSNTFYFNLYKAWEQAAKKVVEPNSEEFQKQMKKAMDAYDKILLENFIPVMPKELQGLFVNPYNYIKSLTKAIGDFYEPWEPVAKNLSSVLADALLNDPTKLSDAIRMWKEGYDKTFGALIKSPVVGSSRESIEQNNKMLDALVNFLIISSEFTSKVMGVANENSKIAFEKYFDLLEEGSEPKTFGEFYKFWSKKVEDAIDKYFFTDEFAKMMGFVADAAMEFKIEADKAAEQLLASTPIVTNSEIDSVYKNVYELKKELRKVKKELKELKDLHKADSKASSKSTSKNTGATSTDK